MKQQKNIERISTTERHTMTTSETSDTNATPIHTQVAILNDLFLNRFPFSGSYGDWFWDKTIIGVVTAHLVSEGKIEIVTARAHISTAWDCLLQHWFDTEVGTDIGFSSLEEIESDDTLERLESMGVVSSA